MLRSTVSKAFGSPPGGAFAAHDPAAPRDRIEAVARLFRALHEAFAARIAALDGTRARAPTAGWPSWYPARLSDERSLLCGVEFVLETDRGSWRFLNTLGGVVSVDQVDRGAASGAPDDPATPGLPIAPVETIGVVRGDAEWLPVRKPAPRDRRSGRVGRAPFEFTSVEALTLEYVGPPPAMAAIPPSDECTSC